ncbi:MAG: L-histidine N(alpha)-methyltransferase [Fidelibacterota bacterium]|nr:MAG: L-histidine N(alpha)-methyltransferase [Candidatus Neomarinimicrobiota bacterium]
MSLQTITADERCTVQAISPARRLDSIQELVRHGLSQPPKTLPPILFYDERGSELFEQICQLPEYYLTRTEQQILDCYAADMAQVCDPELVLVELGSGSSTKTRTLLDALFVRGQRPIYRPIDISQAMLQATAEELTVEYPDLQVHAIASDYEHGLEEVGKQKGHQKAFLFLGSNLGNFTRSAAVALLGDIRQAMHPGDLLFLGLDLVKPLPLLLAAYDDRDGVTAAFNKNVLARINRELDADFNLERFRHQVVWNAAEQAIEMHLRSLGDQQVRVRDLELAVTFRDGETIHTESSHKYTQEILETLSGDAGLEIERMWLDENGWFALNLLAPKNNGAMEQ